MDSRIISRISEQDALHLRYIAEELGLNLSEFVRLKVMGKSFDEPYLKLIKRNMQPLEIGEEFTLKKLLILHDREDGFINDFKVSHFDYLSKSDKNALINLVVDEIENEEINAIYQIRKNGKFRFKKIELFDFSQISYQWDD